MPTKVSETRVIVVRKASRRRGAGFKLYRKVGRRFTAIKLPWVSEFKRKADAEMVAYWLLRGDSNGR